MSLVNPLNKMSKSSPNHRSRILITASPDEIRQRIMGAVTDSFYGVTYEPASRPGVANLLEILSQCTVTTTTTNPEDGSAVVCRPTPSELAAEFAGLNLGDLKREVVKAVTQELAGVRDRFEEVLAKVGGKHLDNLQAEGAEKARRNSAETMRVVRDAVGLAAS